MRKQAPNSLDNLRLAFILFVKVEHEIPSNIAQLWITPFKRNCSQRSHNINHVDETRRARAWVNRDSLFGNNVPQNRFVDALT